MRILAVVVIGMTLVLAGCQADVAVSSKPSVEAPSSPSGPVSTLDGKPMVGGSSHVAHIRKVKFTGPFADITLDDGTLTTAKFTGGSAPAGDLQAGTLYTLVPDYYHFTADDDSTYYFIKFVPDPVAPKQKGN